MSSIKHSMKKVGVLLSSTLLLAAVILAGCAPASAPVATPQAGELTSGNCIYCKISKGHC